MVIYLISISTSVFVFIDLSNTESYLTGCFRWFYRTIVTEQVFPMTYRRFYILQFTVKEFVCTSLQQLFKLQCLLLRSHAIRRRLEDIMTSTKYKTTVYHCVVVFRVTSPLAVE